MPYLIGTDAAINQLITGLPKELITVEFVEKQLKSEGIISGPLEKNRESEYYVDLLRQLTQKLDNEGKLKDQKGNTPCNHFDKSDEEKGLTDLEREMFKQAAKEAEIFDAIPGAGSWRFCHLRLQDHAGGKVTVPARDFPPKGAS